MASTPTRRCADGVRVGHHRAIPRRRGDPMTVMTATARLRATEFLDVLVDPGSWRSWDEPIAAPRDRDIGYAAELALARARTGLDEAVITGEGRIQGHRVAVVAC